MDVRSDAVVLGIPGEGSAAEDLQGLDFDVFPERALRVLEGLAGSDQPGVAEAADERDVAGADTGFAAEGGQRLEEILAVVEGDSELPADGDLGGAHGNPI